MIAVVLVNWNGHRDTIECLESLLRQEIGDIVVLVVDNGSSDGSIAALTAWAAAPEPPQPLGPPWRNLPDRRLRPPVLITLPPHGDIAACAPGTIAVVPTGANLGFAGANNVGMAMARRDPRIGHIWLLNNDTVVAPDALTRLRTAASARPKVAIWGSCLMYYDRPDIVQGVAGFFKPWLARGGHLGIGQTRATLPAVAQIEAAMAYVLGAAMFLPIATYDAAGPMSESYFLYYEEPDWAARLPEPRHQSVALDAVVYHKEGGSIGSSSRTRPSDTSLYYLNRNLIRFMWRWHPAWAVLSYARILRQALTFARHRDVAALRILWRALRSAGSGKARD